MESTAAFRGDLRDALSRVGFPIFMVDTEGRHVWLNEAAVDLGGDRVGQYFGGMILPEYRRRAQEEIVRRLHGMREPADFDVELRTRNGEILHAEISAVPLLEDGHVVGIFGIARTGPPSKRGRRPTYT